MWTPFRLVTLAGLAALSLAQDTTPTPTTETPSLMGWFLAPTSTERLTAHSPWVTKGDYAGECSTEDADQCTLPTACQANTLTWDNGGTAICRSQYSCVTFTIFETSPAGLPSASSVGCWQNWSAWTIYRTRPDDPSTSSTESTSSTTSTAESTSTPDPTPTDDPDKDEDDDNESSSGQGWIAGAVIGPVAGLTIIGAAAFFYLRRKKPQYTAAQQHPYEGPYYGPTPKYVSPESSELPDSEYRYAPVGPASEMPGAGLAEMSATRQTYELSSMRYN